MLRAGPTAPPRRWRGLACPGWRAVPGNSLGVLRTHGFSGKQSPTGRGQPLRSGRRAGLVHLALSPLLRFLKFYVFRLGFLDGRAGLVHISIGCMNSFMKYAKLMELRRSAR